MLFRWVKHDDGAGGGSRPQHGSQSHIQREQTSGEVSSMGGDETRSHDYRLGS